MGAGHLRELMLVMVAGGCGDNLPPFTEATALIEMDLASDGCDYLVKIPRLLRYAPDEASRAAIRAHMVRSNVAVTILYRLTGDTGEVWCGNGSRLELPEIELKFP
jgi:hypothetical protein